MKFKVFLFFTLIIFCSCSPSLEEIAKEHECIECRSFLANITKLENDYHFYLIDEQGLTDGHNTELQNLDKRAIGETFLRVVEEKDSEHLFSHLYCYIGCDMEYLTQLFPYSIIESKTKQDQNLFLNLKYDIGRFSVESDAMYWLSRYSKTLNFKKVDGDYVYAGTKSDTSYLAVCDR